MIGTLHEKVYRARGHGFIAEFYADLDYTDDGGLIITREHDARDPADAAARCLRAITEGKTRSRRRQGHHRACRSICVHSDTPNAVAVRGRRPRRRWRRISKRLDLARRSLHGDPFRSSRRCPAPSTASPAPDQPAYKNDGDTVAVGDVIGLIEVMKSFHEVKVRLRRQDRALPRRERGCR